MVEMKYVENDSIKLPNNIRQVGTPGDKLKIYIEDYVMTYLSQVANEKSIGQKAAILLGEKKYKEGMDVYFISAAIRIEDTEITEDTLHITGDMWEIIYGQIEHYFKEKHILGWFLTRPGQSVDMNERIEKVQSAQFGDKSSLFYSMDQPNQEEAFYFYENGHLVRQQGYYIYYERNEAMQNYMVEKRQDYDAQKQESAEFQNRLSEKKAGIKDRKANYVHNRKHQTRWVSQAAAILLVATVLIAVRRNMLQRSIVVSQTLDKQVSYETLEHNPNISDTVYNETNMNENVAQETDQPNEIEESSVEQPEDKTVLNNTYQKYTVKEGDTLVAISRAYYQDLAYVDQIIRLNQIENPDYIYPGMVLNMP